MIIKKTERLMTVSEVDNLKS